jgi:hypothetical protein
LLIKSNRIDIEPFQLCKNILKLLNITFCSKKLN